MSPVTHFFIGWLVANTAKLDKRDRALVTVAGIISDADSLVIVADLLAGKSEPFRWYGEFHHVLTHNIGFAFLVTLLGFMLAKRRWITTFLVFISFHLHLLGDIAGSRGPDDYQWPIPYLWPFSNSFQLVWEGQWELNAWQNVVITGIVIALTLFFAWKRGYSPLEMISATADAIFVRTLRQRFGNP